MYTNSEPSLSIQLAIEATRFITPFDEGLTTKEIYEITERLGFMRGEVSDAFMNLQKFNSIQSFWGSEKVTLGDSYPFNTIFWMRFRPDPVSETLKRSIVLSLLDDLKRNGSYNYSLNIELFSTKILEMDSSNTRLQIYSFLRSLEMAKWIKLADDKKSIIQVQKMSLEGAESIFSRMEKRNESERFHKIYPIVIEVMSRRGSIIPTSTDPVDGFYEFLEKIRGEKYKLWWIQISSELRQLDHKRNPTSLIVLSCAMCEAMLTLVIDFSMGTDFEMTKFIKVNEPRT